MTLTQLKNALASSGLPVAYDHFPAESNQGLPCITYQEAYTSNFFADEKVFVKRTVVDIFLWTGKKDQSTEELVESALTGTGLLWEMTSETFEEDDQVFQRIYEVTI